MRRHLQYHESHEVLATAIAHFNVPDIWRPLSAPVHCSRKAPISQNLTKKTNYSNTSESRPAYTNSLELTIQLRGSPTACRTRKTTRKRKYNMGRFVRLRRPRPSSGVVTSIPFQFVKNHSPATHMACRTIRTRWEAYNGNFHLSALRYVPGTFDHRTPFSLPFFQTITSGVDSALFMSHPSPRARLPSGFTNKSNFVSKWHPFQSACPSERILHSIPSSSFLQCQAHSNSGSRTRKGTKCDSSTPAVCSLKGFFAIFNITSRNGS